MPALPVSGSGRYLGDATESLRLRRLARGSGSPEPAEDAPSGDEVIRVQMSRIAAVVPCFNAEAFLAEAIESILRQTRPVQEIIIVDDCSTDSSPEIARRYPVRLVRTPSNAGEAAARNLGIREAKSDLIAWLDADDYWEPHHIATVCGLLESYPRASVAFGGTQRFGARNETILGYVPLGEPRNVLWLALQDWVHTTISSVIRRQALLDIGGFDESERYSVDFDLWLRLARAHLFVATHEVTANWRWHSEQQSQNQRLQMAAQYRFRKKFYEALKREDGPLAEQVAEAIRIAWMTDMARSWESNDTEAFRFFYRLHSLVPDTELRRRYRWMIKALLPAVAHPLLRGYGRLRPPH
jgi:GT2 family glycosyltransferase